MPRHRGLGLYLDLGALVHVYGHVRIEMAFPLSKPCALPTLIKTRGPLVLYRSPEYIGYAELEQAWKYMIMCCISFEKALGNKFDHIIKMKRSTQRHHLNKFGST